MAVDGSGSWPRLRGSWWVLALTAVAAVLFAAGFVVRVHCGWGGCGGSPTARLLDLDGLGGLPRLFTTALFVGVAVLAGRTAVRVSGGPARWWGMLTVVGVGLALAKLTSLHGFAKTDVSPLVTLLGGLAVTAVALGVLSRTGRRWAVPGARAVVVALAVYAAAALGLDVVTGVVEVVRGGGGPVTDAAATFVEEFGEALAALLVLGTVRAKAALAR